MPKLTAKKVKTFPFPKCPDKSSVTIRHLKPGEIQKIEAEFTEWTGKPGKADEAFTTELKFNPTMQMRAVRIASIEGWKGFRGLNDEVLECNKANLNLYFDEDPEIGEGEDAKPFSQWIDDFRKALADEVNAGKEAAEKN